MYDKPTVIIIGRQSGTANAFAPVINALREQGINLATLAFSHAYDAWKRNGINAVKIESYEDAVIILDSILDPCFMLTGTSHFAREDSYFWDWAHRRVLPNLAFVDHWVSYWQRFSTGLPGSARFDVLPERIAVIDELAATRMIEAGCPPHLILITGHPAFDILPCLQGITDHGLRAKLIPSNCSYLILFVSEPHSRMYASQVRSTLSYTERDALTLTLTALERIGEESQERFCLVVKPHPLEEPDRINCVLKAHKTLRYVTSLIADGPRDALVEASDVIVGGTSMLLYEASLMGRPVISVQPNRIKESDLVDYHNGIELATNMKQTQLALHRAFNIKRAEALQDESLMIMPRNATHNFTSYIFERFGLGNEPRPVS